MKRFVFKNWVSYTLMFFTMVALFVLCSDQVNMKDFLLVHLSAFGVIVLNIYLLIRFGKEDLF